MTCVQYNLIICVLSGTTVCSLVAHLPTDTQATHRITRDINHRGRKTTRILGITPGEETKRPLTNTGFFYYQEENFFQHGGTNTGRKPQREQHQKELLPRIFTTIRKEHGRGTEPQITPGGGPSGIFTTGNPFWRKGFQKKTPRR